MFLPSSTCLFICLLARLREKFSTDFQKIVQDYGILLSEEQLQFWGLSCIKWPIVSTVNFWCMTLLVMSSVYVGLCIYELSKLDVRMTLICYKLRTYNRYINMLKCNRVSQTSTSQACCHEFYATKLKI